MRNRRITTILASVAMLAGFAFAAAPAWAITIVPACATKVSADPPSLQCVEQTFLNVASLIIAISGSFALLMFVYGGFTMIISNGNDKKVAEGKTIIRNAVIGILLIFLAGYIIDYIKLGLTKGSTLHTADEKCNDGRGAYITVNGVTTCQTPCAAMGDLGYSCIDPSQGRDCNPNYISCGGKTSCCVGMTGEELDAREAEQNAAKQ